MRIPVPYREKLDTQLTADCPPRADIPLTGKVTVDDVQKRLSAVEDALFICRMNLEALRQL